MTPSERGRELIQKYLDSLASESELTELEGLLATDPEIAVAFAEAARLDAGLERFFRKQYRIAQVSELLNDPELSTSAMQPQSREGLLARSLANRGSTFVPRYAASIEPQRSGFARFFAASRQRWRWIAAAMVLLTLGVSLWKLDLTDERPRLVSGHVTVAGRGASEISDNVEFEVGGTGPATIELRGTRIELAPATRTVIVRQSDRSILRLLWGHGEFRVPARRLPLQVETSVGIVTATEGRFSLELSLTTPERFSSTEPISGPRLAVAVMEGSVTVEQGGQSMQLAAGDRQVFFEPA